MTNGFRNFVKDNNILFLDEGVNNDITPETNVIRTKVKDAETNTTLVSIDVLFEAVELYNKYTKALVDPATTAAELKTYKNSITYIHTFLKNNFKKILVRANISEMDNSGQAPTYIAKYKHLVKFINSLTVPTDPNIDKVLLQFLFDKITNFLFFAKEAIKAYSDKYEFPQEILDLKKLSPDKITIQHIFKAYALYNFHTKKVVSSKNTSQETELEKKYITYILKFLTDNLTTVIIQKDKAGKPVIANELEKLNSIHEEILNLDIAATTTDKNGRIISYDSTKAEHSKNNKPPVALDEYNNIKDYVILKNTRLLQIFSLSMSSFHRVFKNQANIRDNKVDYTDLTDIKLPYLPKRISPEMKNNLIQAYEKAKLSKNAIAVLIRKYTGANALLDAIGTDPNDPSSSYDVLIHSISVILSFYYDDRVEDQTDKEFSVSLAKLKQAFISDTHDIDSIINYLESLGNCKKTNKSDVIIFYNGPIFKILYYLVMTKFKTELSVDMLEALKIDTNVAVKLLYTYLVQGKLVYDGNNKIMLMAMKTHQTQQQITAIRKNQSYKFKIK